MKTKGYLAGFEMLESMGVRDEAGMEEQQQEEAGGSGTEEDGSDVKKE